MPQFLNKCSNGFTLQFDKGCFDNWCVYVTNENKRFAPADIQYFARLKELSLVYRPETIYDDFVVIYNRTTKAVDTNVFELIKALSQNYNKDASETELWFNVLYAGMIAEENKENAILKKRIKRLGMYQLLMANFSPKEAANFSKGKKWRELDKIMSSYGF